MLNGTPIKRDWRKHSRKATAEEIRIFLARKERRKLIERLGLTSCYDNKAGSFYIDKEDVDKHEKAILHLLKQGWSAGWTDEWGNPANSENDYVTLVIYQEEI